MKDSRMFDMMYTNALHGLENGCLMPWDKEILASNPLPASVIEPYTTKEVPDVLESMNITFSAMSVWIDEAKKVNYFSKRFVQLSRMVMNGVTTMGRGLITLHARGESLEQAPMSIQDLLGVASYHFRKSYLGVLQTSRSQPELGEKLLMNQIGWCNMLMRLFKTRDKLAKPVISGQCAVAGKEQGTRIEGPEGRGQNSVFSDQGTVVSGQENAELAGAGVKKEELASGSVSSNSGTDGDTMAFPASSIQAFTAPSAYTEPGAFIGAQAFKSYDSSARSTGCRSKKAACSSPVPASQTAEQESETASAALLKREDDGMDTGKSSTDDLKCDAVNAEHEAVAAEPKEMILTATGQSEEKDQTPEISEETKQKTKLTETAETKSRVSELPEEPTGRTEQDSGKEENKDSQVPGNSETVEAEKQNKPESSPSDRIPDPEMDVAIPPPEEPPEEPVDPWLEYDIREKLWYNPWGWDDVRVLLNEDLYCSRHPEHVRIFKKLLKELEEKGHMDPPDAAYRY